MGLGLSLAQGHLGSPGWLRGPLCLGGGVTWSPIGWAQVSNLTYRTPFGSQFLPERPFEGLLSGTLALLPAGAGELALLPAGAGV